MAQQTPQWTEQQRQAYYQRYYSQYRQPASPPKNDSHLFQILMLIGVLIIVAAVILYFVGPEEETVVQQPVIQEVVEEPAVEELKEIIHESKIPLEIVSNEFVFDLEEPVPVSDEFVIDDEILIYTIVEGFDYKVENGKYVPDLIYGMQVIDPNGEIIENLNRPGLVQSEKTFDEPKEAYYFTSKISTFNMVEGKYKVNIRVFDAISGQEAIYFKHFTLSKPKSIFLSEVYLRLNTDEPLFSKSAYTFNSGDNISLITQISGFEQEGKALNVDVDLKVYQNGELQLPLSNYIFFDMTEALTEEEHSISLDGYIDTTNWLPGDYTLELVAIDHKSGKRDTSTAYLTLR